MTQTRWQKLTEWPLTIVAVIFLAAYAWYVIADLQGASAAVTEVIVWATWIVFLVDYLVLLALAERRWLWFRTHLFDFLVVALPMLRPLRLLRVLTLLRVLQRTAGNAVRGRIVIYTAGSALLLIFVAALAVLDVERPAAGATITTFGEAAWWAFVTVTTVGYGDFAPVTATGRVVAAGLMIGGIALLSVVTATLASWIVQRVTEGGEDTQAATRGQLKELKQQLTQLQATLDERR